MDISMEDGLKMYPPDNTKKDDDIPPKPITRAVDPKPVLELDLHGCTVKEALDKLEEFVNYCYARRLCKVKVIFGKGLHSKDSKAILKEAVMQALSIHQLVKQTNVCQPKDGGLGATFVILK